MTDYEKMYADSIVSEYSPKTTSKAEALKKLDHKAKLPSNIFAYTFGTVGSLLLGVGMCLTMNVIGDGSVLLYVIGIIVGLLGIGMVSLNYTFFKRIRNKGKQKYGEDILRLAREIKAS